MKSSFSGFRHFVGCQRTMMAPNTFYCTVQELPNSRIIRVYTIILWRRGSIRSEVGLGATPKAPKESSSIIDRAIWTVTGEQHSMKYLLVVSSEVVTIERGCYKESKDCRLKPYRISYNDWLSKRLFLSLIRADLKHHASAI